MEFIDKLKQATSLFNSVASIENVTKFEAKVDIPGVVFYGKEYVFSFNTLESARDFVNSMNQKMDELFLLEKSNIEILAKEIFNVKLDAVNPDGI